MLTRVETYDHISGTRLVNRYAYHHGFYDRHEREFRGFGLVEQWDTEEFGADFPLCGFADSGIRGFGDLGICEFADSQSSGFANQQTSEAENHITPPVHTKTWFHNGYFEEESSLLQQFRKEYYQGDSAAWALPDSILPNDLDADGWREAHRALKGQVLRTEVYGEGALPYTVSENNYEVQLLQPNMGKRHAAFLCRPSETLSYQYEGQVADPRINHALTIEADRYGLPLWTAAVAYGRRGTGHELAQSRLKITVSKQQYIHLDGSTTGLRIGLPRDISAWELTGVLPVAGKPFENGPEGDLHKAFEAATAIKYETAANHTSKQKRPISFVDALYYNAGLTAALPAGQAELHGLPYKSSRLVLTSSMKTAVFGALPELTDAMMKDNGGYEKRGTDFYAASAILNYDKDVFYTISKAKDSFGAETLFTWDDYGLFPLHTEDALGNTVLAEIDYRVLSAWQVTDPNGNRQAVAFDIRGMVVKTAVMGKVGGTDGDTLAAPTTELAYDLFRYLNQGQPNYAYTKARETHGDPATRWLESYTYTDGLGRILLEKAKVAPGKAFVFIDGELQYEDGQPLIEEADPRWLGSGRIVYNNKGEPVKQYEPYFSNTPEYEKESEAREFGVSPLLHYDALGRNIRIDHPDGSFEEVIFDCWRQKHYDRNDTVQDSQWYMDRDSPAAGDPEPSDPEKRAAWLAIRHYDTPQVQDLDVLGRVYRQRQDNGSYDGTATTHEFHDTVFDLDIEGKRRKVTDARGNSLNYTYDMRPPAEDAEGNSDGGSLLLAQSPDSGPDYSLFRIDGQPLMGQSGGHQFFYYHDLLGRPTIAATRVSGTGSFIVSTHWIYGEGQPNPELQNLRGQLYILRDGAGEQKIPSYDFKGNPLTTEQRLLADPTAFNVNWNAPSPPALAPETYTTSTVYDALNRPLSQTDPGGNIQAYTYDEGGTLKTVKLNGTLYVKDIRYNEKGQREAIWYGNNTKTGYTYDPETFRLKRLLTTGNTGTTIYQDLNYHYDPVGNITQIKDDAQQILFFNNSVIDPIQKFAYDALYRLTTASGRELKGTAAFGSTDNWDDAAWKTTHKGDGSAVQNYTQQYSYDKVGNITALQHIAGIGSYTRTYTYAGGNNRLAKTKIGGQADYEYSYDGRGNMTKMPHLGTMAWNPQNELRQVALREPQGSTTYFQYSGGHRMRKHTVKGTVKEERIYFGSYEIYRKFVNNVLEVERTTVHVSDDTGRIAMVEDRTVGTDPHPPGLTRYIYSNHLQSASVELEENGEIASYEEYHPYGTTSYQAMNASINAVAKRYRYTGKEREESGLYYHGARYYVPWLARWTAVDPLESKYAGMSPYNYGFNNPIIWQDSTGMEPDHPVLTYNDRPVQYSFNREGGISAWGYNPETESYDIGLGMGASLGEVIIEGNPADALAEQIVWNTPSSYSLPVADLQKVAFITETSGGSSSYFSQGRQE